MTIARHHAEWLSLLEISGPFLSMPALLDAFPQGLEAHDPEHVRELRAAYEEWADNQGGLQPDPAIHHAWIRYVLRNTLELPDEVLAEGQAIPDSIKTTLPEYGEVLRPSLMVKALNHRPLLLIQVLPATQSLEKPIPKQPWKAGPATRLMTLLHATEIRLGLVTNGEQWMLVDAPRGETTGFISWYAGLWLEEPLTLRAFRSLLGADRFFNVPDEQTLTARADALTGRMERLLRERAEKEMRDIEAVLTELAKAIEKELDAPAYRQLELFTSNERDQLTRNTQALQQRLAEIPAEIAAEQEAIRARFVNPQPRLFPVAVTFLVPEKLI